MQQPLQKIAGRRLVPDEINDRMFTERLEDYITAELGDIRHRDDDDDDDDDGLQKERHSVFKSGLGQLTEHLPGYSPLLTFIRVEYEDCIQMMERGKEEALFLSGKVKTMVSEQTTLTCYAKRADQLRQILSLVKANTELFNRNIKAITGEQESCVIATQQDISEEKGKPAKASTTLVPLPGLELEELTNVNVLRKQVSSLEQQRNDLLIARKIHYSSRDKKNHLKMQLANKSKAKDHVTEKNLQLKARCQKLRIALDTLKTYSKEAPLDRKSSKGIIDALARSISRMSSRSGDVTTSTFDDDDPSQEREAEMLLEYIEYFNELFEEGHYKEAAMHAANSPKGILRTAETLQRFKAINVRHSSKPSPLLEYCEALMSSVPAASTQPNADISMECVRSALMEDRLDLVMHWLAQKRLTLSEPVGHLLYNYHQGKSADIVRRCLSLAEAVYTKVGAHIQAAVCMCKQGKVQAMMDYARGADFGKDMYVGVLVACPSLALAEALVQPYGPSGKPVLSLEAVVTKLLHTEHSEVGLRLLDKILQNTTTGLDIKELMLHDGDSEMWTQVISRWRHHTDSQDTELDLLADVTVLEAMKEAVVDMSSGKT